VRLTAWLAQDSLADADGLEVIVEDVTEQRDLEEQLRHAQKMEAVGRLAGGLAHDFNNVLTIIKGYGDLLLDQFQQKDRAHAQLEEIRKAADRAAALTSQLQSFSHHQILSPRVLNLNQIVRGMEKMLRRLLGEDIDLKTVLDPFLGNVKADQGQVEQVIMNLVGNARDAMPHGGQLIIDTGNVTVGELSKSEQAALAPGRYVMLAITDTGIGMDAETRSHVFEPFFTTKQRGTGLGLATVYGVAKQTGGHTVISSEPGRGTTVKVYLPRVDEALEVRRSGGHQTTEFHGTETILLVEDDDSLRPLVQQMLQQFGYTVLETGNSEQAMAVCERYQGPIHLLLTDVVLQRKSGTELASRILAGRPEMRVLYMSGHSQEMILSHGISGANFPLIQKPFAVRDLAQKVREALDSTMG
jgi:nitrogen-specific signal transduction histidine kinase